MNNRQFCDAMEHFGRSMNIPLRDVLKQIQESGQMSLTIPQDQRDHFLLGEFLQWQAGFPEPLPKGTKSIYELGDHSSE